MLEQLETLYKEALEKIENITSPDALQEWESSYIGKKGSVTLMLRSTGQLPKEERAAFGQRGHQGFRP